MHMRLEEEIFYPAFKGADGKAHAKQYFEAIEEHRAVESLVLPDFKKTDPGSEQFAGRAKVLRELIRVWRILQPSVKVRRGPKIQQADTRR